MKKVISGLTATALFVGILSPMVGHAEEKTIPLAKCEINIIKGKHTKQSPAYGSGICKDLVEGFYSDSAKVYRVSGMVETQVNKSGQKHIIGVPYDGYSEAELTIYLNKTETPKTETALKVLYKGKVNKTTTTVRDSNSTKGKSLGTLKKNATVEVVESKSGWYKIKHNKGYGWVVTSDVTKDGAKTTTTQNLKVLYKGKTTSDLNVRNSNSTKGKKLGTLKKNTTVEVVESKSGWYKIKYDKSYGWVSSSYVKKETTTKTTTVKVLYKGKVNKSSTTVRNSNSTKGKKLGTLKKNATVEVVESKSGWYKVKYNKGYGWVVTKDVTKNSTTTTVKVLYKGKVNKSSTTVRNSNSTKGKKLGTLKKNATVEVVESKSGWYKIKYNKGYGWVVTKDVTKNSTVKVLYKGKTTSDLNVRSTNSTKGKKLGTLKKNTKVEVVQSKSGWYKIKYKKDYGWVSSKYVKKS